MPVDQSSSLIPCQTNIEPFDRPLSGPARAQLVKLDKNSQLNNQEIRAGGNRREAGGGGRRLTFGPTSLTRKNEGLVRAAEESQLLGFRTVNARQGQGTAPSLVHCMSA
ncbi:hypothetical protein [Mesorhizobium sp.]|uniref:hypothetical protein n=1 Tax=Mesorhizobium sp. TaxID=1871066 RepID=UPI0025F50573|nr:hypothetical protein [Mesorhizobium sp.]